MRQTVPRLAMTAALVVASSSMAQELAAPVGDAIAPGVQSVDSFATRHAANPLLPGYFADPTIIRHNGRWYVYATKDPWGGDDLAVWSSRDFANWTFHTINWPTKAAATSPTSGKSKVWAPSVIKARDGRFWMYVSAGNEIWVGSADNPLGPWRDENGGKPLIHRYYRPGLHMIDAEAFIDDDGTPYLYWGSGLNWVNGHCFVVRLKPDMVTFDGEPRDITPSNYFEAPYMLKVGPRYLLTYSYGNTTTDTYQVRYAVGDSPFGPFREAADNPVLASDLRRQIISPGHHSIFRENGRAYILYHRHGLPFDPAAPVMRQIAVDRLNIHADGRIDRVRPTHNGVRFARAKRRSGLRYAPSVFSKSNQTHSINAVSDDNFATLWRASAGEGQIVADLGRRKLVREVLIFTEFPDQNYRFSIEGSQDGKSWVPIGEEIFASGSPLHLRANMRVRYIRLNTLAGSGIFEWVVR